MCSEDEHSSGGGGRSYYGRMERSQVCIPRGAELLNVALGVMQIKILNSLDGFNCY